MIFALTVLIVDVVRTVFVYITVDISINFPVTSNVVYFFLAGKLIKAVATIRLQNLFQLVV